MGFCKSFCISGLVFFGALYLMYGILAYQYASDLVPGKINTETDKNPVINFETEKEFQVRVVNVEDRQFSVIVGTPEKVLHDSPIVFVHGFPDNFHSWSQQMRYFVQKGYRVYSPEIRGYEPQAIPENGVYLLSETALDLVLVIEALQISNVNAMGHDWGSTIVNLAARMRPNLFRSIGMFSVPEPHDFYKAVFFDVPRQFIKSWYIFCFQLPWLPESYFRGPDESYENIGLFMTKWYNEYNPARVASVVDSFKQPGVLEAALGYYRQFMPHKVLYLYFTGFEEEVKRIAALQEVQVTVPSISVTGTHDACLCDELFDICTNAKSLPAGFELHKLEGAGHFVQHERPEEVSQLIENFLATL